MILILSLAACMLAMVNAVFLALGRLRVVYVLGVLTGLMYVALNVLLAIRDSEQTGVALLVIPSLWAVATSAFGLWRLGTKPDKYDPQV